MLHLIYLALAGALIDEVVDSLGSGLHGRLELVHLIYSKGQARKRDEHVASAALEPRIASKDVVAVALKIVELMSRNEQAILEGVAWRTNLVLVLKHLLELA